MLNRDLLYKTAENMGVKIDDDAFKRFDIYAELLFETNKKFNLTAITSPVPVYPRSSPSAQKYLVPAASPSSTVARRLDFC